MAENTPSLDLYKKQMPGDATDKFNISTMLNDNWDKIDEAFDDESGHAHTGATGDGPKIASTGLANGAATDTIVGNRTITDTGTPSGDSGTLTNLFSWLGNMVKAITGKSSWRTAPATTLEAANTHHNATSAHSATSAATASRIMIRDVNGRAQVATPSAAADIARKDTVDAVQSNLTNHIGTGGSAHANAVASGAAGFMTGTDKTKLDGIAAGAQVNTVSSVAGKTGAVTLAKGDVGLGNVDNVQQAPITHVGAGGTAHAAATTSVAGFMSASDKTKLDGVASGANNYTHPNHTGDVTSTGDGVTAIAAGVIVNADINSSAAIAWSKISKTGSSLVDLATRSAGDLSSGTLPGARMPAISGDVTMSAGSTTAAITAGAIVNADINASAAIDASKIANGAVSNTEFQYLDGVTSAIQTQLNGKAGTSVATTSADGLMASTDKQLSANRDGYGSTGGSGTAYTVTLSPVPTGLVDGLRIAVKLHTNSGTNPTLNANSLGAKAVLKPSGSAPASGLLKSGSIYTLIYSTTAASGAGAFILQGEGGEYGTAVAAEVLAGKTIGTESGLVTGTMVDRSGDTAALSSAVSGTTLRLRASEGYRDGTNDYVTLTDADFVAENIRDGVNLFGVTGSLSEELGVYVTGSIFEDQNTATLTASVGSSLFNKVDEVAQFNGVVNPATGELAAFDFDTNTTLNKYDLSGNVVWARTGVSKAKLAYDGNILCFNSTTLTKIDWNNNVIYTRTNAVIGWDDVIEDHQGNYIAVNRSLQVVRKYNTSFTQQWSTSVTNMLSNNSIFHGGSDFEGSFIIYYRNGATTAHSQYIDVYSTSGSLQSRKIYEPYDDTFTLWDRLRTSFLDPSTGNWWVFHGTGATPLQNSPVVVYNKVTGSSIKTFNSSEGALGIGYPRITKEYLTAGSGSVCRIYKLSDTSFVSSHNAPSGWNGMYLGALDEVGDITVIHDVNDLGKISRTVKFTVN